jgi:hypothetical protein
MRVALDVFEREPEIHPALKSNPNAVSPSLSELPAPLTLPPADHPAFGCVDDKPPAGDPE